MLALQPLTIRPTTRALSLHACTRSALAALLSLVVACGDSTAESATESTAGPGTTDDDAAATTGLDTGAPSDPDTGAEVPTTGAPDEGTTGEDGTSEDDGGSDGTTTDAEVPGPVDPDIVDGCRGYCERWAECGFQPDLGACVDGCAQEIGVVEASCEAAQLGLLSCKSALSCEVLLDTLGEGPCAAEAEAVALACGEAPCGESLVVEDDVCSVSVECGDDPAREMKCDADGCRCFDGGEEVGACAADGACAAPDVLGAKMAACCGF